MGCGSLDLPSAGQCAGREHGDEQGAPNNVAGDQSERQTGQRAVDHRSRRRSSRRRKPQCVHIETSLRRRKMVTRRSKM